VAIVLYDGECGLCHAAVRAILRRDRRGRFRFARQGSAVGARLLAGRGLAAQAGRTLVLLDDAGAAHVRSEAALRIAAQLDGPVRLAAVLRVVPRRWRDALYDLFARHRHRLGFRRERCPVPSPAERARFLDEPAPR
jgi:predicted DCC family thiol-disulfide oxidoreductase YuxK